MNLSLHRPRCSVGLEFVEAQKDALPLRRRPEDEPAGHDAVDRADDFEIIRDLAVRQRFAPEQARAVGGLAIVGLGVDQFTREGSGRCGDPDRQSGRGGRKTAATIHEAPP